MVNRTTMIVVWLAAVLTLGTAAIAQTPTVADRFTFVVANASKAGGSGQDRMQIVINQWSPDTKRDRFMTILKQDGSEKLTESFRTGEAAGYIQCPGYLHHTIRFAYRVPRADGGEDVILATDHPVWLWWDASLGPAPTTTAHGTVVQLHLNREGSGEGKLSIGTKLTPTPDGKLFTLQDYARQPVVLTDVKRERNT